MKRSRNKLPCDVQLPFEFEALEHANNYRKALLDDFRPYIGSNVLEVGGGIGQFSELLLSVREIEQVTVVEPDSTCRTVLESKKIQVNIVAGTIYDIPEQDGFDSIVSINVLEHIEQDAAELQAYIERLKPGGYFCLYVPARNELYSPMDKEFGHYRRYTKKSIHSLIESVGFEVVTIKYANMAGYFLWWLSFKLLRNTGMKPSQVKFHDRFIFPITRFFERTLCAPIIGQSLMVIARRART